MKNFSIIICILIASICSSVYIVQGQEKEDKPEKLEKKEKEKKVKLDKPWEVNSDKKDEPGPVVLIDKLLDQNVGIGLINPQVKLHIFQEYN
ncbi:MAG: hypothetical protein IH948_08685, partial [Bacteroidetes bacterium]|nr:hypothetical protein [Bacteroidota bacterium]